VLDSGGFQEPDSNNTDCKQFSDETVASKDLSIKTNTEEESPVG
jgi:hypothetical protein